MLRWQIQYVVVLLSGRAVHCHQTRMCDDSDEENLGKARSDHAWDFADGRRKMTHICKNPEDGEVH